MVRKYWSTGLGLVALLTALWLLTTVNGPTYIYNTFYTSDGIRVDGPTPPEHFVPPADGVSDVQKDDEGRVR